MIITPADLFIFILFIWFQCTLAVGLSLLHMVKKPKPLWVYIFFWAVLLTCWPYTLITNFFDMVKAKLP